MPAVIKKDGTSSKPWCVYSHEGGKRLGCHETEEKAKKQQAAVNMNVQALTFSDMESLIRRQWAALFDPEDYDRPYLRFIFPEYAVFTLEGKYYKVEYEMDKTDVEFDTDGVSEVDMDFRPVRSGAVLVPRPIKSIDESDGRYKAYAAIFGDDKRRDAYGTYFDRDTRYYLDWWNTRPWLYHHGLAAGTPLTEMLVRSGMQRIGTWDNHGVDDVGVFVEGELDLHHEYIDAVKQLLDNEQILFPSSGTIDHIMSVADDGHIEDWPIAEVSSTVAPAELRMKPISQAGRAALRALGGIPEGRYQMGVLDDILGRKSKDVEETEEVEGVEAEGAEESEEVTEPEGEETGEQELDAEELAVEVARHLDLDKVVGAIQQIDETVKGLSGRVDAFEKFAEVVAKDEPQRVKSFVEDPEWHSKLFSATRSAEGEEPDEEDVKTVQKKNEGPEKNEDGVYGAVKV